MERDEAVEILRENGARAWNALRAQGQDVRALSGAAFNGDRLDAVDFSRCDLSLATFDNCSLRQADFLGADLENATFDNCSLIGARFSDAFLLRAHFNACDVADADFLKVDELSLEQFRSCVGLETATLPEHIHYHSDSDVDFEDDDDDDDDDDDQFVQIDGEQQKLPTIPRRVPAPIETAWIEDRLALTFERNVSNLESNIMQASIVSFRLDAGEFANELRLTNTDRRVIQRLEGAANEIPIDAHDFSQKIFRVWHQFLPIFEYSKIAGSEEGNYIRARFLSLERNLLGILSSFPEWRSYQYEASKLTMPEGFDIDRLKATRDEIVSSLMRFPTDVESNVTESLSKLTPGAEFGGDTYRRPIVYDFAASFANVLSRIIMKVIDEIGNGGLEGVREGTKKLVAAIMIGGGAAMIWLISSGLSVFPWLSTAWQFVRKVLGL